MLYFAEGKLHISHNCTAFKEYLDVEKEKDANPKLFQERMYFVYWYYTKKDNPFFINSTAERADKVIERYGLFEDCKIGKAFVDNHNWKAFIDFYVNTYQLSENEKNLQAIKDKMAGLRAQMYDVDTDPKSVVEISKAIEALDKIYNNLETEIDQSEDLKGVLYADELPDYLKPYHLKI